MANHEENEKDYYDPILQDFHAINNAACRREWFIATEPHGERPKHQSVIHTARAETIMQTFISRLRLDVLRNSRFCWQFKTAIPGKGEKIQPLGDQGGPG